MEGSEGHPELVWSTPTSEQEGTAQATGVKSSRLSQNLISTIMTHRLQQGVVGAELWALLVSCSTSSTDLVSRFTESHSLHVGVTYSRGGMLQHNTVRCSAPGALTKGLVRDSPGLGKSWLWFGAFSTTPVRM